MAIRQLPNARQQYFDGSGNPLAGGKVYTYEVGTSTPKPTYSDANGSTPNANPVILDSRGEALIFWDGEYSISLTDANDVQIYSQDNYGAGATATLSGNYNLVDNGAFENDTDGDGTPDGWEVFTFSGGTFELDTSTQQTGAQSAKFTNTGNGGGHLTASDFSPVAGGQTLSWSFWINTNNASIGMKVGVRWFDANESLLSESAIYDSTSNPTAWTQQSGSVDAPANARYAKVRVYGGTGSVNASGWFDDVRLMSFTRVDIDGHPAVYSDNGQLKTNDGVVNQVDGSGNPAVYEDKETVALTGDFDNDEVTCVKQGSSVTISANSSLSTVDSATVSSNTDIPTRFRPSRSENNAYLSDATGDFIEIEVNSNGSLSLRRFAWDGTSPSESFWDPFTITYIIQ